MVLTDCDLSGWVTKMKSEILIRICIVHWIMVEWALITSERSTNQCAIGRKSDDWIPFHVAEQR